MRAKKTLKYHYNLCNLCSKAKPIGREKRNKIIIIIVTFARINSIQAPTKHININPTKIK